MTLEIRLATKKDAKDISDIGRNSFYGTFLHIDGEEAVTLYVKEHFNLSKIESEFNEKNVTFFVAYYNNLPAGFLKLRTEEFPEEIKDFNHIEIQRIYVLKDFQDCKVGLNLMLKAFSFCKDEGYELIWLGVSDKNVKALNFYQKLGFEVFGKHIFHFGTELQEDLLMKKNL